MVVNWYLVEKLVVNWELGTSISTLFWLAPSFSSRFEFQHGAFASETFARPKKTPALQARYLRDRGFWNNIHCGIQKNTKYLDGKAMIRESDEKQCGIFPPIGAGSDFPPVSRSGNGKIQIYWLISVIVSFLISDSCLSNKKQNTIDFFANLIWQVFHHMQRQQNGRRFWFSDERKRLSLILWTFWPVGSSFLQFSCYIVMSILYSLSLI